MRRAGWMIGVAAIAVLAACTDDPEPPRPAPSAEPTTAASTTPPEVDLTAFREGEIPTEYPRPDLDALPPEPGDDEPLEDRLAWEALEAVNDFASIVDPDSTASCPDIDPEQDYEAVCTVEYFGESYDYRISNLSFTSNGLSDGQNEFGYLSYSAALDHGPIVRDQVEAVLRYKRDTEYVACDMDAIVKLDVGPDQPWVGTSVTQTLATGIECRALDPSTGTVETFPLDLFDFGSPSSFD